ncbi:universal stress protein [Lentzea sp. NEAU-D7]|uniref:universal stress protein n=1 Tax=Lentzea sp. NEAU-D7 TaxID=2994667 RepID=UPI00224A96C1|nr:universal stress protein [Lentzea sp. NEAU-D7]MCX2946892.1 universal stress protein [Lentzea sp. NEAU-D7]
MMEPAPVVAGVDGSSSALAAVMWAADECARRDAPLRLVHAFSLPAGGHLPSAGTGDDVRRAGEACLTEATVAARAAGPEVEISAEPLSGGATSLLIEESRHARLLVLGAHGMGNVRGLLVGSTAAALASHGQCPLVVVRGLAAIDGPIVVGHDGSPTSEAALAYAFEAASLRGARLTVVLCQPGFTVESAYRTARFAAARDAADGDDREVVARWQARYPEVRVERALPQDRPVRALMRYGAEAQLLVVGSHGRGGFDGMLLGSTSQALVSHAPCPLVIVTSESRRGPVRVCRERVTG